MNIYIYYRILFSFWTVVIWLSVLLGSLKLVSLEAFEAFLDFSCGWSFNQQHFYEVKLLLSSGAAPKIPLYDLVLGVVAAAQSCFESLEIKPVNFCCDK